MRISDWNSDVCSSDLADLTQRLQRWRRETGKRAEASRALVKRWTGLVSRNSAHRGNDDTRDIGICLALAFPDRISRRRNADGEDWISAGGRALDRKSTRLNSRH